MDTELAPGLRDVVREFEEFEKRTDLFIQDTLNDFGYRKLQDKAGEVESSLESVKPDTEYGELVRDDILYNLRANTELADFLRRDSNLQVDEMFDLLYGDGAFEKLVEEANSYDEEAHYRARELYDQLTLDDPWKFEEEIEPKAHEITDRVERWAKQEGLMPEDFEFETQTIPRGSPQRANWRGEINQMNIPIESGFYVIRNGGGLEFDATNSIFSQFHELVGHGVHQYNSRTVEYPQFTEKTSYRPSSMAHSEGVSQHREQHARQFIQENNDELPVTDIGMELRNMSENNRDLRKLYAHFVYEMLDRDEIDSEEAEAKIGEVFKPEVAEVVLDNREFSTFEAFQEGSYSSGMKLMEEVGAESRPTHALTTGQWSPEVFPRAVEKLEGEN